LKQVALGFKAHSGWAAVVAVAGSPADLRVLLRRRIELLPADGSVPKQVYHAAEEVGMPAAADFVARCSAACEEAAVGALREVLAELGDERARIGRAGLVTGSGKLPERLESILKAHAFVHAAEDVRPIP